MLNRTLLVPPVRLGSKALRYVNYDSLKSYVSLSGKEGLKHCSMVPLHVGLPPECSDYFDYTQLSWEWLVDLHNVKTRQPIIFRWNLSDAWIHECLGISDPDILTLRDSSRYHFRFLDTPTDASLASDKYQEDVYVPTLRDVPQRLLQIGTLFGTSRLRLQNGDNRAIRRQARDSMSIANPILLHVSGLVLDALGRNYLGAHIRLGDGQFSIHGNETIRAIWQRLVHEVLGYSVEDTLLLEDYFSVNEIPLNPPFSRQSPVVQSGPSPLLTSPRTPCRKALHSLPHLSSLNIPLYISTDIKDPSQDSRLTIFLRTFPCTFFLDNFGQQISVLDQLVNHYDGLPLKPFVIPFVEAMVIGKAWRVVGTPGSTFSRFVEDYLWPKYHGLPVKDRG